ncbi:MAG: metal-dependent transcriptional regulator [Lentisphaerae bacterium]|nr:metal-dependent transcriptional regulator [Lentisphaerota bacterium]
MPRPVSAALEDYLEAIAELDGRGQPARSRDIAARVGVHKSTVTAALRSLSAKGLAEYSPYSAVALTDAGRRVAEQVRLRHCQLRRFLVDTLGMGAKAADAAACRLEHAIDRDCLDRLVRLGEFLESSAEWRAWSAQPVRSAPDAAPGRAPEVRR